MTVEEAKVMIKEEFIRKYYEFLADVPNGTSYDFGRKYGIMLTENGVKKHIKDNLANLKWFQQNIFTGRWIQGWEKAGYEKSLIRALHNEGFLSYQGYYNHSARASGRTEWYFIPQRTATAIYKEFKKDGVK